MFYRISRKKSSIFPAAENLNTDSDFLELERKSYLENISPLVELPADFIKKIITPKASKNLFLVFIILSGLLLLRSVFLQIINNPYFAAAAEKNRIRISKIKAERGLIKDRNQIILADNRPQFIVTITPGDLPKEIKEREQVIAKISRIIDLPITDIQERVDLAKGGSSQYEPINLADDLVYEKAVLLEIESNNIPGLNVEFGRRRTYYNKDFIGSFFSHIIGYIGYLTKEDFSKYKNKYSLNDNIGKTGLELAYEDVLKGADGKRKVEVDAMGRVTNILAEENPKSGDNLILSLDANLQKKVFEILGSRFKGQNLKRGAVIVLNPQNGQILSLVSLPTYDNEKFIGRIAKTDYETLIQDSNKPLFNRAIAGEYPSGSTIKPFFAAAALEEGIINRNTSFLSVGGLQIGQWFFPDWKAGGHGLINVTRALAESVNTFFYIIGGGYQDFNGLGLEKILKYAQLFGFSQKSGIDLPGERDGFLPTAEWKKEKTGEPWYIGDTYHLSIGQGYLSVTPLQIAMATAAIANNGTLYKPTLLQAIENSSTGEVNYKQPEILRDNFLKSSTIKVVQDGMRDTVVYGSARSLGILPVAVAGKTGTAQWQEGKRTHAWFIGYAPFKNPQIVVTILIEEGGEGSSTAVPIAKDILEWWFNYKK